MKKTNKSEFEYKPIQTELNYKDSEFSNNETSNQIDFSSLENEEVENIDESYDNNAALEISNKNKLLNYNSLESLRISHSMDKNDNSVTLFERINGIKKDCDKNKISDFETPKKKDTKKVELIPDVFNYSSTNNKNVQVSELDIKLNSSNTQKNKQIVRNINNNSKGKDFKKELEKNLKEYFEKKSNLNQPNLIHNQKKFNTIENLVDTEIQKYKHEFLNKNKKNKKEYKSNSMISHSSKNIKSSEQYTINKSNKPLTKNKLIYNSVKKSNNKKEFYTLINKINNEYKNTSLKNISNTVKRNYSFKSKYRNKESATSALTNCSSSKKLSKNSFNNNNINNNNNIITEFNFQHNIPKSTRTKNFIPNKKIKIQKPINFNKDDSFYKRCSTDSFNKRSLTCRASSQNEGRNKQLNISSTSGKSNSKPSINEKKIEKNIIKPVKPINVKKKINKKEIKIRNEFFTHKNENKFKQFTKELIDFQNKLKYNKPDIQIYKNNIKHITIAPISSLAVKMMEKSSKIKKEIFKNNLYDKNMSLNKYPMKCNSKGKKI